MAYLTFQELTTKYNLSKEQKAIVRTNLTNKDFNYKIEEEPVEKITGRSMFLDTKISTIKCDEDSVIKLLNLEI